MATSPLGNEAADLLYNIVKRSRRVLDERLAIYGLTAARAKVLISVGADGPMRQSAIACAFDLAPRTVTELVDALERDGLVERREDANDRRAREVHLTPAGEAALADVLATREEVIRCALDSLGPDRLSELVAMLREICDCIGALEAAPSDVELTAIAAAYALGSDADPATS